MYLKSCVGLADVFNALLNINNMKMYGLLINKSETKYTDFRVRRSDSVLRITAANVG